MDKRTINLLHLQPRTDEEHHHTIARFQAKFDHKRYEEEED